MFWFNSDSNTRIPNCLDSHKFDTKSKLSPTMKTRNLIGLLLIGAFIFSYLLIGSASHLKNHHLNSSLNSLPESHNSSQLSRNNNSASINSGSTHTPTTNISNQHESSNHNGNDGVNNQLNKSSGRSRNKGNCNQYQAHICAYPHINNVNQNCTMTYPLSCVCFSNKTCETVNSTNWCEECKNNRVASVKEGYPCETQC